MALDRETGPYSRLLFKRLPLDDTYVPVSTVHPVRSSGWVGSHINISQITPEFYVFVKDT